MDSKAHHVRRDLGPNDDAATARSAANGPAIVRDHFETFRAQAAALRDGEGLPQFVEQELRDFLRCGWRAGLRASNASGAAPIGWSPFPVKGGGSVRVAAGAA